MLLKDLLSDVPGVLETRGDAEIQALVTDSREKARNGLFFCISGMRFDAHDFAAQAVENGCVALVVEHFVDSPVAQVRVDNVRRAAAYIAAAFYGHPARKLRMVRVRHKGQNDHHLSDEGHSGKGRVQDRPDRHHREPDR